MTTNRWWLEATCRGADTDMFDSNDRLVIEGYCMVCPVRRECLQDALSIEAAEMLENSTTNLYYIRGGKTASERYEYLSERLITCE